MTSSRAELRTVEDREPQPASGYFVHSWAFILMGVLMSINAGLAAGALVLGIIAADKPSEVVVSKEIVYEVPNQRVIFLKILALKPKTDHKLARHIAKEVDAASRAFHRDPDLILAMTVTESHFKPDAVSRAGAVGLMQVMPFWLKVFNAEGEDLKDVRTNVRRGVQIYNACEHVYANNQELALTAYNRGSWRVEEDLRKKLDPRNGYAKKVLEQYEKLKSMR